MRSSFFFIFIFFIIATITTTGCYYDKEELLYGGSNTSVNCTTVTAKFAANVKPIIASKCATPGCHNAAGSAGGSVLETYAQISAQSARIKQRSVIDKTMPVSGPLSAAEIAIINCWIESGALNN
jgi:uncharacterized membrane protein